MTEASHNTEQDERVKLVRDQLAALGEAPPSEAELALLRAELDDDSLEHEPAVASVARLAELAEPIEFEDLSQLELHRGWRGVEQRLPGGAAASQRPQAGPVRARPWLFAALGVAAAAAVLLLVIQPLNQSQSQLGDDSRRAQAPGDTLGPDQLAELAQLGDQARSALRLLDDGQTDTERATQLAAAYQRRLAQTEEQGG